MMTLLNLCVLAAFQLSIVQFYVSSSISPDCESILTPPDIDFYRENGYIIVHDVFNQNNGLAELQSAYDSMFERRISEGDTLEGKWKVEMNTSDYSSSSLLSIHDFHFHDSRFAKYIFFNQRLGCFLELGTHSNNVLLHHTKAHLKPYSIGVPFPAHQDFHYFPYKKDSMIAVFIHLDDTTKENGGLRIWPKSHLLGALPDMNENFSSVYHYINVTDMELKYEDVRAIDVNVLAGDTVVFSYLTVHASYPNLSNNSTRRMLLMECYDADDEPLKNAHRYSKGQGFVLRGINPNIVQESHYKRKERELKEQKSEL